MFHRLHEIKRDGLIAAFSLASLFLARARAQEMVVGINVVNPIRASAPVTPYDCLRLLRITSNSL
jgi:hypothetical protein